MRDTGWDADVSTVFLPFNGRLAGESQDSLLEGGGRGAGEREEEGSSGSCNPPPPKKNTQKTQGPPSKDGGLPESWEGNSENAAPRSHRGRRHLP